MEDICGLTITLPDGADSAGGAGFGGVFVVCLFEIRQRESPNFGSGLTWSSAPNGARGFVDTNPPDTFIHNTRLGWIPTNCNEIFPGG